MWQKLQQGVATPRVEGLMMGHDRVVRGLRVVAFLALCSVGVVGDGGGKKGGWAWCEGPEVKTVELSSLPREKVDKDRKQVRFVIAMMGAVRRPTGLCSLELVAGSAGSAGAASRESSDVSRVGPRVGSKMLKSMLEGWGGGEQVFVGGEKHEELMDRRYGASRDGRSKLDKFFRDPHFLAGRRALGYKTENYLEWRQVTKDSGEYGRGEWYGEDAANATMASLDARARRRAELNLSGARSDRWSRDHR